MRVFSRSTLAAYFRTAGREDSEGPLRAWLAEVLKAQWTSPADIKARYPHASFVGNDRVVFNIGGNKYRLIVRIDYAARVVLVRFIGTHAEYDDVDAASV